MSKKNNRMRTTISLDKEVHKQFVEMSKISGESVSRCMGEWLADTVDAAQFVHLRILQAKNLPIDLLTQLEKKDVK